MSSVLWSPSKYIFCRLSKLIKIFCFRILRVQCEKLRLDQDFSFESLARLTPGFVGADLMSLTREAALIAVNRWNGDFCLKLKCSQTTFFVSCIYFPPSTKFILPLARGSLTRTSITKCTKSREQLWFWSMRKFEGCGAFLDLTNFSEMQKASENVLVVDPLKGSCFCS